MNGGIYFGQLVIGSAGSGKSTYCKTMQEMAETLKRNIVVFNLDPAAQHNEYRCDIDIQELVLLEDVMEEMELGPNGGLLFCMEYLLQNQDWLQEKLNQCIGNDDYVIFDCPGQIELYTDQGIFREIVKILQNYGFSLVSMFLIDSNFILDESKFMSALLQSLAAQTALQLPSITVLSKCDLLGQDAETVQRMLEQFAEDDEDALFLRGLNPPVKGKVHQSNSTRLFTQIRKSVRENDATSIRPLNINDEDSLRNLLLEADTAIQYGENLEPDDKAYDKAEEYLSNR